MIRNLVKGRYQDALTFCGNTKKYFPSGRLLRCSLAQDFDMISYFAPAELMVLDLKSRSS